MVAALTALIAESAAVGDLEAARVAYEAVGRLLGSSSAVAGDAAEVIDLAGHRKPRRTRGDRT